MSGLAMKSLRFPAMTVAVLLLTGQAPAPAPLQRMADDAALAAAQVLAAGGPVQDALAAADRTLAGIPGAAAKVTASPADRSVTVAVSADARTAATGMARYQPADHPAHFAWAARQHFALKQFVVGSTCRGACADLR